MKSIYVGDYVKVMATGKAGEVIECHGNKFLVSHRLIGEKRTEALYAEKELQRINIAPLSNEQIRSVVRGETPIATLTFGLDIWLASEEEAEYSITLEDLAAGLKSALANGAIMADVRAWLEQVIDWLDDDAVWENLAECNDREVNPVTILICLYWMLKDAERFAWDGKNDDFLKELKDALGIIETWQHIGFDPECLNEYPDQMLRYLAKGLNAENIDREDTNTQQVFRKCLDILCEHKDVEAMDVRAYCWYCGTAVYPQSWEMARDAYLEIYEMTGKAYPANVLGYIYYYGRCNGGVPEYGKALHWFSIGHAGGNNESSYKLGDLFFNGYAVKQNPEIAFDLYKKVYDDTLSRFEYGDNSTNFADAARRLGECYRTGAGCDADPEKAYAYYLQARLALQKRIEEDKRIGDDSVMDQIHGKIESQRETYTDQAKTMKTAYPHWLEWAAGSDKQGCLLTWEHLEDGTLSLSCRRLPKSFYERTYMLAVFPAGDYCELLTEVKVKTDKGASITVIDGSREVIFDRFLYNAVNKCAMLMRTGRKVAEIYTSAYHFRPVKGMTFEEELKKKSRNTGKKKADKRKNVEYFPWEKRPLTVKPVHKRKLKAYGSIQEFQEEYRTKEEKEEYLKKLRNYEIDELIGMCDTRYGKMFYDQNKKLEKIFEYSIRVTVDPFRGTKVRVYDGPGTEKYVEYVDAFLENSERINLNRNDIRAIQAAMEDNLLFETNHLESNRKVMVLDGVEQDFFFAVKGRENEIFDGNLEYCKGDYENCIHAAHVIQTLEKIRDILVPKGVPEKYFALKIE